MEIVKMEHVTKIYGAGDTRVWALDDVNLTIDKGETLAVVGASGSGKSTLLHVMGGVDTADSGNIVVDGKDITTLNDDEMSGFRRRKQQQRAAIARALANRPSLILADEPTGALDSANGSEVMTLLQTSVKKLNQTLVLITHNIDLAREADRIIKIADGKIIE